uniref:Uncharacterized protein n=1 Tax=Lepeophtheirus salmonis TaxID=72036 RepID=A0A0K2V2P7_LEPSM
MREAKRRRVRTQCIAFQPYLRPLSFVGRSRVPLPHSRPIADNRLNTTPKTMTVAGNLVFMTLGTSLLFTAIQRWFWELWI